MRITKLELENFKRFTKLTIDMTQLSAPPKLVLLIGANGSGKSSVFDAFEVTNTMIKMHNKSGQNKFQERDYYIKHGFKKFQVVHTFHKGIKLVCNSDEMFKAALANSDDIEVHIPSFKKEALSVFYGRTSLRQVPRLTRLSVKNGFNVEEDSDRPLAWIDRDERFENDIEKTNLDLQKLLFDLSKETTNREIIAGFIQPISNALARIFDGNSGTAIKFVSIVPPGDGQYAEILFTKGNSTVHYNLLSSGEKEIFNILLDLSVRGKYYQDTIYFIDEMDLHLEYNTQKAFLKEITENWIPDTCQLWTASHSLGFIQYANENEHAAIIDLDNLDFDFEQTIYPSAKNSTEVYEIAVDKDFLATLFSGKNIAFAEGEDAAYYNQLGINNYIFIKSRNKNDVFYRAVHDVHFKGIIDRDYLSDHEIEVIEKNYANVYLLRYYCLENYLFHPDNLAEHFEQLGKQFDELAYIQKVIDLKNENLDKLKLRLSNSRSSYPFFKENESKDQLELFKNTDSALPVVEMLNSNDFETFYKVFPAKDYGKTLAERQNLNKYELAKTKWFKKQIEKVLNKDLSDS